MSLGKGSLAEEALRRYFFDSGYFALRSVPFSYQGFDVTDVDIWLYGKPSAVSRERMLVDAKNRKTPQAIERVLWTLGLQRALRIEGAIVATTDKRPAVNDFGHQQGVLVLDGEFLTKVISRGASPDRLSEEDLTFQIRDFELAKYSGDWKARFRNAKGRVLSNLDYDEINAWMEDGRFFAQQCLLVPLHKETACRLCYLMLSLVALGIDFRLKELAFRDEEFRKAALEGGLRFGSSGLVGMSKLVGLASGLVERFLPESGGSTRRIQKGLTEELDALGTAAVADYFSRKDVGAELFSISRQLDEAAYRRNFFRPEDLPVSMKSLLGVALDFWQVNRVQFFKQF